MDKEKEAKGILEGFFAKLSAIAEPKKEDVVTELSEEVEETVEAAAEEVKEVVESPVETELSAEPTYVTKDELDSFKAELSAIVKEGMKAFSEQAEEVKKEVVELSAQPAAQPIKHAPDSQEASSTTDFKVSDRRPKGMMDTVLKAMNQYK